MLSFYQYEGRGDPTLLISAFVIYVIALISDFLDGYLARKWKVEGAFGRVVDPFADKILVLKDGCVALFGPREQALQQLQKLRGNAAAGRDSGAVMLPRTARNNDEQPRLEAGVR